MREVRMGRKSPAKQGFRYDVRFQARYRGSRYGKEKNHHISISASELFSVMNQLQSDAQAARHTAKMEDLMRRS